MFWKDLVKYCKKGYNKTKHLFCFTERKGWYLLIGKTHLYTGLLAGAGLALALDYPLLPTALTAAASALGGVLPDLDHPKSKITQKFGVIGFFSSRLFRHRGVLHTPTFHIAVSLALLLLVGQSSYIQYIIYGLLVGELSHLLLDALTPKGIPLLWPLTRQHISLLPIPTYGMIDHFIGRVSLITGVLILLYLVIF